MCDEKLWDEVLLTGPCHSLVYSHPHFLAPNVSGLSVLSLPLLPDQSFLQGALFF